MACAGDTYSRIRHDLRMALRGLFKAYATRNWQWVSSYAVKVNRQYLMHHRAVFGEVQYRNHDDVACGDTFIPPEERTLFGRRKNQFQSKQSKRGFPSYPYWGRNAPEVEISTLQTGFSAAGRYTRATHRKFPDFGFFKKKFILFKV